ncbi:MAG: hypothetical protein QW206_06155 [Acidilobaceae archaeon]
MNITKKKVLKAVNEFHSLSESKFKEYIVTILSVMSNEELISLLFVDDLFVRINAFKILEQRVKNIVDNSLEHHDGIDAKDYEPGLNRTDHYDVVDNETSEKLGNSKPGSKMVERV